MTLRELEILQEQFSEYKQQLEDKLDTLKLKIMDMDGLSDQDIEQIDEEFADVYHYLNILC